MLHSTWLPQLRRELPRGPDCAHGVRVPGCDSLLEDGNGAALAHLSFPPPLSLHLRPLRWARGHPGQGAAAGSRGSLHPSWPVRGGVSRRAGPNLPIVFTSNREGVFCTHKNPTWIWGPSLLQTSPRAGSSASSLLNTVGKAPRYSEGAWLPQTRQKLSHTRGACY